MAGRSPRVHNVAYVTWHMPRKPIDGRASALAARGLLRPTELDPPGPPAEKMPERSEAVLREERLDRASARDLLARGRAAGHLGHVVERVARGGASADPDATSDAAALLLRLRLLGLNHFLLGRCCAWLDLPM